MLILSYTGSVPPSSNNETHW